MAHVHEQVRSAAPETTVLHTGGIYRGSEHVVVEEALRRQPGVLAVDANAAAQSATVTFDPGVTSVEELARWVEQCGYHCSGRSVPGHICDPLAPAEPLAPAHDRAAAQRAEDAHGHGGHAGMSMDSMARDMRNRFWSRSSSRSRSHSGRRSGRADVGIAIGAGHRRRHGDRRCRAHALRPARRRHQRLDRARRGAQDAPESRLGDRLQLPRLPIAARVFKPFGLTLRPEIAAISMSGSSVLVAVNALTLKRLGLPAVRN
jgi:copper chaperone CopZ